MILDSERQKELLQAAIAATNWSGQIVEEIAALKAALASAQIAEQPMESQKQ